MGREGGSKGNVRGGATVRGAMKESEYFRVTKRKEIRRDDPIKYFLPTRFGSIF